MSNWNALVVEDEPEIRRFVRKTLEEEGWRVYEAGSVISAHRMVDEVKPDLILLDLGLPDGDGVTFMTKLRQKVQTPVIVLSARNLEGDKVAALDAGADDYLTKPFGLAELLARVRVVKRRLAQAKIEKQPVTFQFGAIEVDPPAMRVTKNGVLVHLTPIEYQLLLALVESPGRVLTHGELLRRVWGPGRIEQGYLVRIHMSHLRGKLEDDPTQPRFLITEAGIGYRLVE
jgi:two-component system, OmpR family, KDP operon response regulator KdpE